MKTALGITTEYGTPERYFWQVAGARTLFVRRDVAGLSYNERTEYGTDSQERHDLPFYAPYVATYRISTEDGSDLARYTVAVTGGSAVPYTRTDCVTYKEKNGKATGEGYGLAPLDQIVLMDALRLAMRPLVDEAAETG